jgi:amino acid transporter/mannitol/fructose-specific phosphotransferase system IIA component (Ntr-type)
MKRGLGFIGLFSIAAGAMISSGIFVLPGVVFSQVGPALWVSYVIAGGIATLGVLAVVELTTAMPKAGGNYFFVMRSLGPLFGTISGVMSWFAVTFKSAFAVYGLAILIANATGWPYYPVALVIVAFFVLVNLLGSEVAGGIETVLVIVLLAIIAALIILGWDQIDLSNLTPALLPGRTPRSVLVVAGLVFVSFGGLVNITSVAEEVKRPAVIIPAATISAVVVVTLLYGLLIRTAVGVAGSEYFDNATNPIASVADLIVGRPGFIAVTVGAALAFVTTALAGVLSASRYPLALARDGLAPKILDSSIGKRGMPVASIILTGVLMAGALALELRLLIEAASVVIALNYLLSNVSVMVMRSSRLVGYRPSFRVPLYPLIPVLAIIAYALLVIDLGWEAMAMALAFIVASLLVYLIYGRRADETEYALQHVVERLTPRELTGSGLERELREIVHESRGTTTDRFDELVQNAICIDVPEKVSLDSLFAHIGERSAEAVGLSPAEVTKRLHEREEESSTALSTFVAVPHIVIPGSGRFQLVLVRTAAGTHFSDVAPEVKAVFVLMGTADERNVHLRSLMALAQIASDESFDDDWLSVRKASQLADLVGLRNRRRE